MVSRVPAFWGFRIRGIQPLLSISPYTGWRKSHFTERKSNIFVNSWSQKADFFINDRGMFKVYTRHKMS